jgi:hypothetical protein
VLHAAIASAPPINSSVVTLRTMVDAPCFKRNDHGRTQVALSTSLAAELTSSAAPRTVLHAAMAMLPPMSTMVITLRSMGCSPV